MSAESIDLAISKMLRYGWSYSDMKKHFRTPEQIKIVMSDKTRNKDVIRDVQNSYLTGVKGGIEL